MDIDWHAVRRQAEQLRKLLEDEARHNDPQAIEDVLRRRAQRLANTSSADIASAEPRPGVLEVRMGGAGYGFELQFVNEVLPFSPPTPLPSTPAFVLGMLLARSRVVSCIDLLSFLGLPVSRLTDPAAVVVLADGQMEIAVLVDEVGGVSTDGHHDAHASAKLPGKAQRLLRGVTASGAFILDSAALLADPQLPVDS